MSVAETEAVWRRLSPRVVWVDVAVTLLSLSPGILAVWVAGGELSPGLLWPLATLAALGVARGVGDIIRWAFTSYRLTATDLERRTGVFVRRHRMIRRDRVRSVDTTAKLRHRVAGLRVVTVGAGQQTSAGESALLLDALSRDDAAALRAELLAGGTAGGTAGTPSPPATDDTVDSEGIKAAEGPASGGADRSEVLARLRPWWVVYNMFSIWAYLMAAGLLWGLYWLVSSFGVDVAGIVAGLADWEALGWIGITIVVLLGCGLFGALGLGVNFLVGYWGFELSRVTSEHGSQLQTRRGLFSTREVTRDESRMRGMSVGEPLLWRWMGMADTSVITTGLSLWDAQAPTAILPRGPISVARRVAQDVFGASNPLEAPLERHPRSALRRRLWWATLVSAVLPLAFALPVSEGLVPPWVLWAALGVWPLALLAAVIAYLALGHSIAGDYVVVRSGMLSRTTSALRRDAVSTIAVRQSVLQRRLGLCTVSAMTAAGWSIYEAPDVAAATAVDFAAEVAPGVLDEFLATQKVLGA